MPATATQTVQKHENSGKRTIGSVKTHRIYDERIIESPSGPKPKRGGWSAECRRKQAEAIRRWQPWGRSTGPRTAAGKTASRMNAYKHGSRSATMREILKTLRDMRLFRRAINDVRRTSRGLVTNAAVRDRFEALKAARSAEKIGKHQARQDHGPLGGLGVLGVKPYIMPAAHHI